MSPGDLRTPVRILYLEDEVLDRELAAAALAGDGLACEFVYAQTEATFAAALQGGQFDLILSDVTLPAYSGLAALEVARRLEPEVPFILVSGTISEEQALASLRAGATDYVLKGQLQQLAPAVRRALRESELRRARRGAEEKLRSSLAAFSRLGQQLSAAKTEREAAEIIVAVADELLGWDACTFLLYAAEPNRIRHVLSVDTVAGRRVAAGPSSDDAAPWALVQRAIVSGGQLILKEEPGQMAPEANPFGKTARPAASLLFVPIHDGARVVGVLSIQSYRPNAYAEADLDLLQSLADYCGGALERIRAQTAEWEAHALLQKAQEVAQLGSWSRSLEEEVPLQWSSEVYRIFGLDPAMGPLRAEDFLARVHPEDRPRIVAARQAARQEGRPYDLDHRIVRPDGTVRWVHQKAEVIRDPEGRPVRLLGVVQDITERKAAEEELREAGLRFRTLFEQSPDGVILLDPESTLPLEFNEAVCRHLGYSADELSRLRIADYDATETTEEVRAKVAQALRHGHLEHEVKHRTKSGEIRDVLVTAQVLELGGRRVFHCIWRDITERKRAESALAEEAARRRVLFEQSKDGIVVLEEGGKVYESNQSFARMLGYGLEEMPQLHVWDWDAQWTREQLLAMIQQVAANSTTFETRHRRKDGSFYDVEISASGAAWGGQRLIYCVCRDISQRRATEAAVQRSEAELEAIYDSTPLMLCLVDEQGAVQRVNRSLEEFVREQWPQASPGAWGEVLSCLNALESAGGCGHGAQCPSCPIRLAVGHTLRTGEPCRQVESALRLAREGGRRGVYLSVSTAIVRVEGQPKVLVCLENITGRKQLEAQFLQAQKMEAIGQLAGGVAHDFNNILAAMMLNLSLLKQNPELSQETLSELEELQRGAERAANLTRQLLLFGRRQVMQSKRVTVTEVVRGLMGMLRRLLGEHIEVVLSGQTEPLWVEADPSMLEQVVLNLCVNARDAMPRGGRLMLHTQSVRLTEEGMRGRAEGRAGEFVCLSVSDTGHGMDELTLKRVFEPFFTTKEAGKGTGLGLATVYGIVKQHRGWVEVESAVGQGTTFQVYLPQLAPAAATEPVTGCRPAAGGGETVLLVEDDESVRRIAGVTLRRLGYEVLEARSGAEALEVWEQHGARVSLLLSDMVMPEGLTGLELAERLRQLRPGLKVVISSGYSADLLRQDEGVPGGIRFLAKPYAAQTLAQTVRECLDGVAGTE